MNLKFECWNVAFRKHVPDVESNHERFCVIPNTFRYWAADPFVLYKGGKYYIFAELYDRFLLKGKLGYCTLSKEGKLLTKWKAVLSSDVHMSFPNPVVLNNSLFLMPESGKEFDLRLYSSVEFPNKWKQDFCLLHGVQVCDTILLDDCHLWAYDNFSKEKKVIIYKRNNGGCSRVFEIPDNLFRLRPGGKAFVDNSKLIIPLQNCLGEYGRSLFFTAIDIDYDERSVKTTVLFEMNAGSVDIKGVNGEIIGIHTFNFDEGIEVIDVKTRKFTLGNIVGMVIKKIKKNGTR